MYECEQRGIQDSISVAATLLLDHTTGDTTAGVAGRLSRIVIRLLVNDNGFA
jgi:hypothetical protein